MTTDPGEVPQDLEDPRTDPTEPDPANPDPADFDPETAATEPRPGLVAGPDDQHPQDLEGWDEHAAEVAGRGSDDA